MNTPVALSKEIIYFLPMNDAIDLELVLFRISILIVLTHAVLDVRFLRSSLVQEILTTVATNYC